jgi:hypothetical protein
VCECPHSGLWIDCRYSPSEKSTIPRMTDNTLSHGSSADGAKLLVRILARRRRATSEQSLRLIFEREGAATAGFAAAMQHALLHHWITRRPDGILTGPRREGREAAGIP